MFVAATMMPLDAEVTCLVEVPSLIAVSVVLLMTAVPMAADPKSSVDSGALRR